MKQNKSILCRVSILLFFTFLIILSVLCYYNYSRCPNPNELYIFSAKSYAAEKPVSILLFGRNAARDQALANQEINLFVDDKAIPSIRTKDDGIGLLILNEYPKDGFSIKACLGGLSVEEYIKPTPSPVHYEMEKNDSSEPKIHLQTDKPFYAPGEIINAKVEGLKPLDKVIIKASIIVKATDENMFGGVEYSRQQVLYKTIKTVADSKGNFKFKLKLPVKFGTMNFGKEDSICKFSFVIPSPPCELGIFANTIEEKLIKEVIVSTRTVRVNCLPEFNKLIPVDNNNIYAFVSDPAGNPVSATIESKVQSVKTNKDGLALLNAGKLKSLCINVSALNIKKIVEKVNIPSYYDYGRILIKTDKLIYNSGDKIKFDIFSPSDGRIFVNIAKDGRSWKILPLRQKLQKAHGEFKIPEGMSGLIQINAYMIKPWNQRIRGRRIIQVGEKSHFASESQMIRARFKAPLDAGFEAAAESAKRNLNLSVCSKYYERKAKLRKEKKVYGRILFFSLLAGLFGTFILLLWNFMRLWFEKDCFLLVSDRIRKKTRDNIFISALAYCFLTFIFWKILDIIKTERINIAQIKTFSYGSMVVIVSYLFILGFVLCRSFYVRKLILKETEDKSGNRVRKSIFLLPYLFFVFIFFQHAYLAGLMLMDNMKEFVFLFCLFQLLALVWFFYVYGIIDFLYTKEEYNSRKNYFAGNRMGLGAGLGVYRHSFFKTWILGGFIYWGVPVLIYFWIVVMLVSMFLPLFKIIEKLG